MGHHQQARDNLRKASVGMYSGSDYPYKSCLCTLIFDHAIPTSPFNFIVFNPWRIRHRVTVVVLSV